MNIILISIASTAFYFTSCYANPTIGNKVSLCVNRFTELESPTQLWTNHVERKIKLSPNNDLTDIDLDLDVSDTDGHSFAEITIDEGVITIPIKPSLCAITTIEHTVTLTPIPVDTNEDLLFDDIIDWQCTTTLSHIYSFGRSYNIFSYLKWPLSECEYSGEQQ